VWRLLSVAQAAPLAAFAPQQAWHLSSEVALRDEAFGALAYHYGNRRLVFLKSRALVALVAALEEYPSAAAALDALVPDGQRSRYEHALARLAASGVIDAR
jgi:mycofactocin biosynthesis protein MftB